MMLYDTVGVNPITGENLTNFYHYDLKPVRFKVHPIFHEYPDADFHGLVIGLDNNGRAIFVRWERTYQDGLKFVSEALDRGWLPLTQVIE